MFFHQIQLGYVPFLCFGFILILLQKAEPKPEPKPETEPDPDGSQIRGNCQNVNFSSVPIGNKGEKAYYMQKPTPMTWMDAVCCCRSRGWVLSGPTTSHELKDIYDAGKSAGILRGKLGWVDYHGYSGVWKSLHSGKVASKVLLDSLTKSPPKKGICMELKPKCKTYQLFDFEGNLRCDQDYAEQFFCLAPKAPPPDCFVKNSGECDAHSIVKYAEIGICPSEYVPLNISKLCHRNSHKKGWCSSFQICSPKNGSWEWDHKSQSYIGEWENFDCPGGLYWNSDNSAIPSCDFVENLSPQTRKIYKRDCWKTCSLNQHDEQAERCAGKFWSHSLKLGSVLKECPKGLIFNALLGTCTKCEDTAASTISECCPSKTGHLKPTQNNESKTKIFNKKFETIVADKFGLDIYCLIDGTFTFMDARQDLKEKALEFTDFLRALSGNYRLGLGAFTDKQGNPQDEIKSRGINTANGYVGYGLWNKMPLTNKLRNFSEEVGGIVDQDSGRSEDIFTGLHQAAVCKSEIGWRDKARKFILVMTDQQFYQQGDKETIPNKTMKIRAFDGKCHLDKAGIFNGTDYDNVDYPSVDQVKSALYNAGIKVIFAIGQAWDAKADGVKAIDAYRALVPQITPTPLVYQLNTKSPIFTEKLVDIIRNAYDERKKSIEIETKVTGPKEHAKKVIFTAKCPTESIKVSNSDGTINQKCKVSSSGQVDYEVTVTLPCPWTHADVKLSSGELGNPGNPLDLASVCN